MFLLASSLAILSRGSKFLRVSTPFSVLTYNDSDWFRVETENDSFQPTIDMLLNVSIFIWFGAVCPWYEFAHNSVIPMHRLIFLGLLILLLRRPPIVFAMHKKIHQIEEKRQALYVGFFGPIGVSAVFYRTYISTLVFKPFRLSLTMSQFISV